MTTQQEKIFPTMIAVLRDIGAIGKDRTNQQQGFKFRSIDQFMNEVHQHFAKHGIFMTTEVLDVQREERQSKSGGMLLWTNLRVKFSWYADDGSCVSSIIQGEGMDSADKGTNKAMAVALKYALMHAFSVPTEEMVDPDASSPDPVAKPKQQAAPPAGEGPKPASDKQIKMIQALCREQEVPAGQLQRIEERNVTGWTSKDASACIEYLTKLPKKGVPA